MPAFRKTIACIGVTMLSLPFVINASFAGSRDHNEGQQHQTGEVVKGKIINIEREELTVRTGNGERMRIQISEDTNMVCRSKKESSSSESQSASSSSSAVSQTQDTKQSADSSSSSMSQGNQAQRAGYRFGDCNFKTGDRIKARIDDSGDAQFVRYVKTKKGKSQSGLRSRTSSDFELPTQYSVLPAGALGSLNAKTREEAFPVKTKEGQKIGNITKVVNSSEGDPAYAIIRKKDGQLVSIPWDALNTSSDGKSATLDANETQISGLPNLEEGESTTAHVQKNWDLNDDEEMTTRERFYSPADRYAHKSRDRKRSQSQNRDFDEDDFDSSRDEGRRFSRRDRSRYEDEGQNTRNSDQRRFSMQSRERAQEDDHDYRPSRYR